MKLWQSLTQIGLMVLNVMKGLGSSSREHQTLNLRKDATIRLTLHGSLGHRILGVHRDWTGLPVFTLLTPSEVDIASFFMFFSKVHLYKITALRIFGSCNGGFRVSVGGFRPQTSPYEGSGDLTFLGWRLHEVPRSVWNVWVGAQSTNT